MPSTSQLFTLIIDVTIPIIMFNGSTHLAHVACLSADGHISHRWQAACCSIPSGLLLLLLLLTAQHADCRALKSDYCKGCLRRSHRTQVSFAIVVTL
jgi:hypothetical protein